MSTMDDGGGLTLNISSVKTTPARKKTPKVPKAPSSWGSSETPSKSAVSTSASPDSLQRKKDRLKASLKKKKKSPEDKQDGGRPKPADNKPFYASLFSHNPEVPELGLPETSEPSQPDVFSGENFSDLQLHPHLVANVTKALGGAEMTRVQQRALPVVLAGGDCLVRSQTGSGKTLAYLLPVIQGLQAIEPPVTRESGLYALIVVPTRELALQTYNCAAQLMKAFVRLVPGYLTGGEKTLAEKRRLRRGLNLLVATPGRLLAHIASSRNLRLGALRWLVLDEADLLLDMGYEKHVRSIVEAVLEQRAPRTSGPLQTVLLSATLDDRVQKLAGLSLTDPTFIDASSDGGDTSRPEGELVTPGQLRQFVAVVPAKLRMVALASFVLWKCSTRDESKMIVFMNTNDMVDYHCALFGACLPGRGLTDLKICKLHGNMPQTDRTGVFTEFRKARSGLLICTDVAARGVDLPHVHWIVQYTPPCRSADYVHRVGRTARAGGTGAALALLTPAETGLVELLREGGLSVSDMSLETLLSPLAASRAGGRPTSLEEAATQLQLHMEETVAHDRQLADMARRAFTSLTRAYATYPAEMKAMLSVKTLHLGHYAKSLCLRETPTALGRWRGDQSRDPAAARLGKRGEKRSASDGAVRPRVRIPQPTDISEFQSGLDGGAGVVRKPRKKKQRNT
ncbi:probable ATP-dependent RNA helicase DDX31 [Amphibalanus amphitrite]|uniref:probable ATP-dependent RNA helicase DDX31 n=1 Tax=Amphibalanus amphitrite TaxID=1232801 RepID=UPI001C9240DC|nr:probable ATP-dependent RNA helicase DDX31 [Amphibalanus amphitrite]